jgi:CcmD family protein
MNNLGYLFAAFAVIWLAVLAYVLAIARRLRALEKEIRSLQQMIEDKANRGD